MRQIKISFSILGISDTIDSVCANGVARRFEYVIERVQRIASYFHTIIHCAKITKWLVGVEIAVRTLVAATHYQVVLKVVNEVRACAEVLAIRIGDKRVIYIANIEHI